MSTWNASNLPSFSGRTVVVTGGNSGIGLVAAILGVGLLVVAAVLYALEAGGPAFVGVPLSAWVAGVGGLWAILAALPRRG